MTHTNTTAPADREISAKAPLRSKSHRTRCPSYLDVDAVLRDGSTIHVRSALPTDQVGLMAFLEGLSQESRLFRFQGALKDLTGAASGFATVDNHRCLSLIALHGDPEVVVGHGLYTALARDRAEIALAVADGLQGLGLGTILVGYLAESAREAGITTFEADVLPQNHRMISVFRNSGFRIESSAGAGTLSIEFPTSTTPAAVEQYSLREHVASVAALRRVFEPSSIAVIGASRRRGSIGGEVFRNLLDSGFPGPVYAVSPYPVVQSVPAYPSVESISGPVDLAVVVVPAAKVIGVARECARKGVQALIVISSGFNEVGEAGRALQAELLEVCRQAGIRLIGPNCMGVLSTAEGHQMNATFAPGSPPRGNIGFMSQSGALGLAVIDKARSYGLGLSTFASVGNKADISGNDLLEYWEDDPNTDVILLYLESFGNPRRFSRIARRIGRSKPILAVKSGRSAAGQRASSSHTGALLAAKDATVDALFEQSGVVRCEFLGEMFDVASVLANQPVPKGDRVGIITNAGGFGILCADACAATGLRVPELSERLRAKLGSFLPAEAGVGNPVDMVASAPGDAYERAIDLVAASGEVDSVIAIFVPPLVTQPQDAAAAIRRAADRIAGKIPIVSVFTQDAAPPSVLGVGVHRVPVYGFPEEAARALSGARRWARWRQDATDPVIEPWGPHTDEAHALMAESFSSLGGGWLDPIETARLLACYAIPQARWLVAPSPVAAGAAAAELGGSVALKAYGPQVIHKTELGAVKLNLRGASEVRKAAEEMRDRLRAAGNTPAGFLIQAMVPEGVEMIVGMAQDPLFGPVVACGAGGTAVELLKDVQVRLSPLSEADAHAMIRQLTTFPLLDGYRGRPKANVSALKQLLMRVSTMVEEQPMIAELDLNPVIVTADGALVADARVRIESNLPKPPLGSRPRG